MSIPLIPDDLHGENFVEFQRREAAENADVNTDTNFYRFCAYWRQDNASHIGQMKRRQLALDFAKSRARSQGGILTPALLAKAGKELQIIWSNTPRDVKAIMEKEGCRPDPENERPSK